MYEDHHLDSYYEDMFADPADEGTWDEYDEYEYVEEADYEDYDPEA